jgi:hypothetical protein
MDYSNNCPPAFSALPPDEEEKTSSEIFPSNYQIILEQTNVKGILTTDCKNLYALINRTVPPACQEFHT